MSEMIVLSERDFKKIWGVLKKYPNVVGMSRKLVVGDDGKPKIRVYVDGVQVGKRTVPMKIGGLDVEVIHVGRVEALSRGTRGFFRPLILGISIGNYDITAGTLGMYYVDDAGNLYLGSNAHVFVSNPSNFQPSYEVTGALNL